MAELDVLTEDQHELRRLELAKKYGLRVWMIDKWYLVAHPPKEQPGNNGIWFQTDEPGPKKWQRPDFYRRSRQKSMSM